MFPNWRRALKKPAAAAPEAPQSEDSAAVDGACCGAGKTHSEKAIPSEPAVSRAKKKGGGCCGG